MSVVSLIRCVECGRTADVSHAPHTSPPKTCGLCAKAEAGREREHHLAVLQTLTVEERLRKMEEWIYDYRPPKPLSEMMF